MHLVGLGEYNLAGPGMAEHNLAENRRGQAQSCRDSGTPEHNLKKPVMAEHNFAEYRHEAE